MKKKDLIVLLMSLILVGSFVIREYQGSKIVEQLNTLEHEIEVREKRAEEDKKRYLEKDRQSAEEIAGLQSDLENTRKEGGLIRKRYSLLKKDLKKAKELKKATRSELYREIRKYKLTLKAAEESILNLTLENRTLKKENLLWRERFKKAESEIVRLEREYAVLKDNFKKSIKLGKKGRSSFAGKLVLFAAGVVTASLIK